MNNQVKLVGVIESELIYDHNIYGENFYKTTIKIKRDSGKSDIIPLVISERLMSGECVGKCVYISGEFRSYNQRDKDRTRLKLYIFANEIEILADTGNINDIFLQGYICKKPTYRHTPLGREIADVMLAVNRDCNKSDYIPCVVWGRTAYYVRTLNAGDCIRVAGRVQSREYTKDGETKLAYELSVNLLERV